MLAWIDLVVSEVVGIVDCWSFVGRMVAVVVESVAVGDVVGKISRALQSHSCNECINEGHMRHTLALLEGIWCEVGPGVE